MVDHWKYRYFQQALKLWMSWLATHVRVTCATSTQLVLLKYHGLWIFQQYQGLQGGWHLGGQRIYRGTGDPRLRRRTRPRYLVYHVIHKIPFAKSMGVVLLGSQQVLFARNLTNQEAKLLCNCLRQYFESCHLGQAFLIPPKSCEVEGWLVPTGFLWNLFPVSSNEWDISPYSLSQACPSFLIKPSQGHFFLCATFCSW
jgi:hypothetical protein